MDYSFLLCSDKSGMYPGGHLRRITGLYGTSEFPPRMNHGETRNASYLAEPGSIFILIDVAFIYGQIGKLFQNKIPFNAFTSSTPRGGEIYQGRRCQRGICIE